MGPDFRPPPTPAGPPDRSAVPVARSVELRCPVGPQRLLAKLRAEGGSPRYVEGGALIELACGDCRRTARFQRRAVPDRVLHRFNIIGELVETEEVYYDPALVRVVDPTDSARG